MEYWLQFVNTSDSGQLFVDFNGGGDVAREHGMAGV